MPPRKKTTMPEQEPRPAPRKRPARPVVRKKVVPSKPEVEVAAAPEPDRISAIEPEVHTAEDERSFQRFDPRVRFYRNIAIGFLCVTVVLFGAVFVMSMNKVTINLVARPIPVEVEAVVQVEKERSGLNSIQGEVHVWEEKYTKEFSPKTVKEEPALASGRVTLKNTSTRSQPLVATTRLVTPEGVLFHLRTAVIVPAEGSVEAEIYADQPGASGNVAPARFTIPGLPPRRQEQIYAVSKEPMQGGIRGIGILGEEDASRAQEEFKQVFNTFVREKAGMLLKNYSGVFVEVQDLTIERNKDIGSRVDRFTLTGTAQVVAIGYNSDELREWSMTKLSEKAGKNALELKVADEGPAVKLDELIGNNEGARLFVTRRGVLRLTENNALIRDDVFLGRSPDQIKDYLGQVPGVEAVTIKFFPTWLKTTPRNPEKVTVIISEKP